MAFKATFTLDGTDYNVLSCSYYFYQNTGADGKPTSGVQGGQISLSVASSVSTALVEWMADPNKMLDGKVTFFLLDSEQVMKELDFTKGYCVSHSESFTNTGTNPMVESIVISAGTIKIGNAEVDNAWSAVS
jgi:hypothetical protein